MKRVVIRIAGKLTFFAILCTALPALAQTGATLENPLQFNTVADFVAGALRALVVIALPIVTFFLVLAGFQYISAQGSEDKISKAHKNFLYVVIGSALVLGAWVLASLIGGTVQQIVK